MASLSLKQYQSEKSEDARLFCRVIRFLMSTPSLESLSGNFREYREPSRFGKHGRKTSVASFGEDARTMKGCWATPGNLPYPQQKRHAQVVSRQATRAGRGEQARQRH